jgi:hypothetical protein
MPRSKLAISKLQIKTELAPGFKCNRQDFLNYKYFNFVIYYALNYVETLGSFNFLKIFHLCAMCRRRSKFHTKIVNF